ncbi:MAG: TIGR01458 family HAD-type hydrolase [Cyanobacteriota bacterium]|nr:TIGR01458 family HAD-type hydrolase [Cyanobacteriota bacterium]
MHATPRALLLDLQGVLVDNGVALDGAVDTVTEARRRGVPIRLLTNTATRHHEQLLQELRTLGFALEPEELFTAPLAALSWLQRHQLRPLALVHPAIAPLFSALVADQGGNESDSSANCVLLGDARDQLSYANLNRALELLLEGAPLIGIGRNRRFREGGHWMLDAGAFLQALEYGADCEATVLGKPSAAFFAEVVQSLELPAASCLMVGDDVEADVQGAIDAGLQAALVQTGKYRPGDETRLPHQAAVLRDVRAVAALLGW